MKMMGLVPTEGLKTFFGWEDSRDSVQACEIAIERLQTRLIELQRDNASVTEQLQVELEIRSYRQEALRLLGA